MIYGSAEILLTVSPVIANAFPDFYFPPCYARFTFRGSAKATKTQYINQSGIKQTNNYPISEEEYFVELEFEETDFNTYQVALGELAALTDNFIIYEDDVICPLTAEVYNDARLTAALEGDVGVYNLTDRQPMTRVTDPGLLVVNTYLVDGTAQTITFHPNQLGKALELKIPVSNDQVAAIGTNTQNGEFYDFGLQGIFFTTSGEGPYHLEVPHLRRISAPRTRLNGRRPATIQMMFQAVCGDDDERERKPFEIYSPKVCMPENVAYVLREDDGFVLREDEGLVAREEFLAGCDAIQDVIEEYLLHEDYFAILLENGDFLLKE